MQPRRLVKGKYFSKGNNRSDERGDGKRNLSADGRQLDFVSDGSSFLLGLLFFEEKQHFNLKPMLIK